MPRPELATIEGALSFVTLTRPVAFLGATSVLIELSAAPLQRRWLPRACIVSQGPAVGADATLRVPFGLALEQGLVRAVSMQLAGKPVRVTAPRRPGDRITFTPGNPGNPDGGDAA